MDTDVRFSTDRGDLLSGVEHVVATGVAEPARIGVLGGSHGGSLSAWLVTQDDRFKAAVPATGWRTLHHTTTIRQFVTNLLRAGPEHAPSAYHARSPFAFVDRVRTPCLNVAGALDPCAPASEAEQFHRAPLTHGVAPALVVHRAEGHGVRTFPATLDHRTRVLDRFGRFRPAGR